jgi:hypothetical protein
MNTVGKWVSEGDVIRLERLSKTVATSFWIIDPATNWCATRLRHVAEAM